MIKNLFVSVFMCIFILFGQAYESLGQKAPYKVGALLDLTEFGAPAGNDEKDALLLEVEKINREGLNGHPIELAIENSASHPTKAVSGLTKLVTQDKVIAVIGPSIGNTIAAVLPMAEKDKVPVLSLSPITPEAARKGYKWTFRMPQSDVIVVEKIIDYLKAKKYSRVVVFHDNQEWGYGAGAELERQGAKSGIQVFKADVFDNRDVDMTPQLIKIQKDVKEKNIQAMVLYGPGFVAGVIAKNMKQLGMTLPVVGNHAMAMQPTLAVGGEAVNGFVFPSGKIIVKDELNDNDPQKKVIIDFADRFKAKYNREPTTFAGHAYDAIHILADALRTSGGDRGKLRDAIEKTRNFIGIDGIFNFSPKDHDGLTKEALIWVLIKNGQFTLLKE